jgi:hypothetical protein
VPRSLPLAARVGIAALVWAAPSVGEPRLGRYACEAARAVGLQGTPSGDRYGGRIELPAPQKRFGLTLDRTEVGRGRKCRPGQPALAGPAGTDAYLRWWLCQATTEATFSGGKYEATLRGDDLNIFRDRLSGWLHLADDLRYLFAYTDFAGNFFLEEGTCEPD